MRAQLQEFESEDANLQRDRSRRLARCYASSNFHLESSMTAKLDRAIKRELDLDGTLYTITIAPEGLKVTEKGKRKGQEVSWRSIISGDATLSENLKISVDASEASSGTEE